MKTKPSLGIHYIYVAARCDNTDSEQYQRNCVEASQLGIELVKKGYVPFVPHLAMKGWMDSGMSRKQILLLGLLWLMRCDALFYANSSPGADGEFKLAEAIGMPVFRSMSEIPDSTFLEAWQGKVSE